MGDPFFDYGVLLGNLNRALIAACKQMVAGFEAASKPMGRMQAALAAAAEHERCRRSIAEFDVAAAQGRLADLADRNQALAARWGITLEPHPLTTIHKENP